MELCFGVVLYFVDRMGFKSWSFFGVCFDEWCGNDVICIDGIGVLMMEVDNNMVLIGDEVMLGVMLVEEKFEIFLCKFLGDVVEFDDLNVFVVFELF